MNIGLKTNVNLGAVVVTLLVFVFTAVLLDIDDYTASQAEAQSRIEAQAAADAEAAAAAEAQAAAQAAAEAEADRKLHADLESMFTTYADERKRVSEGDLGMFGLLTSANAPVAVSGAKWCESTDPAALDPSRPLYILIHGYVGTAEDPIDAGGPLAVPEAVEPNAQCASLSSSFIFKHPTIGRQETWWLPAVPDNTTVGAQKAAAAIFAWMDANIPAEQSVIPMGYSQGGTIATELIREQPTRFKAAVSFSGWITPDTRPEDEKLKEVRPPVFFSHGTEDTLIPRVYTVRASRFLAENTNVTDKNYEGLAHHVTPEVFADVGVFVNQVLGR